MLIGILLLGTFAYGMWRGVSDQQQVNNQWLQQVGASYPVASRPVVDPTLQQPFNGIDFAIRIPRLHYFAAVKEGVSATVLDSGPGRYPGTVWPGDNGTVGVAAHNVYWFNFPQLGLRDELDIETRYGTFRYRVTGRRIVTPNDLTVMVPNAPGRHLVLTTCWPLWAGAFATQRFVIFAEQFYPTVLAPSTGTRSAAPN